MSNGKRWCFTINNWTEEDLNTIKAVPHQYLVVGKEISSSGTPHLQGFITFKGKKRLSACKKLHATAHWELAKGTSQQASDYCKKDGDFFESGVCPSQGKRTDLEEACNLLKSGASMSVVADEHPTTFVKYSRGLRELAQVVQKPYDHTDVRGLWYVGPPGTGKSRLARSHDSFYLKQQNKWFDGYAGEKTIILDDLDTPTLGHHLKIWSDRYACTGETKGGQVQLRHERFIVTSNYTIDKLFGEDEEMRKAIKRRFTIRDFGMFPYNPDI